MKQQNAVLEDYEIAYTCITEMEFEHNIQSQVSHLHL